MKGAGYEFFKREEIANRAFFPCISRRAYALLLPTEAKVQCEQQFWLLYVLSVSVTITVVLLLIVKKYEVMGVALITATSLLAIRFVFESIASAMNGNSKPLGEELTLYDMISWVLIWFVPFAITTSIKLLQLPRGIQEKSDMVFQSFCF